MGSPGQPSAALWKPSPWLFANTKDEIRVAKALLQDKPASCSGNRKERCFPSLTLVLN